MLRDECADPDCGHAAETHHLETHVTDKLHEPLVKVRTVCQAAFCECRYYTPPMHSRR